MRRICACGGAVLPVRQVGLRPKKAGFFCFLVLGPKGGAAEPEQERGSLEFASDYFFKEKLVIFFRRTLLLVAYCVTLRFMVNLYYFNHSNVSRM